MDNQEHQPLGMQTPITSDSIHIEDATSSKTKYRKISNRVRGLIVDNVTVRKYIDIFMGLSSTDLFFRKL